MAAEEQSGLTKAASNEFFNAASQEAWRILREWHGRRDPKYLAALPSREELASLLAGAMPMDRVLLLGDGLVEPRRGAYVLDKVVGYAASRWDPAKADSAKAFSSRGKLRHLTDGKATVKEKQAVAGRASAEAKERAARDRVLAGMEAVHAAGSPFNQSEVSRASGVSRKTVGKHWRFCLRAWVNRCVDKKGGINPDIIKDHTTVQVQAHDRTETTVAERNPAPAQNEAVVGLVLSPVPAPVVRMDPVPAGPRFAETENEDDSDESDLRLIEDQLRFQESDSWQDDAWDEPDSGPVPTVRPPLPAWMKRPSTGLHFPALSLSNPAPILT